MMKCRNLLPPTDENWLPPVDKSNPSVRVSCCLASCNRHNITGVLQQWELQVACIEQATEAILPGESSVESSC